MHPSIKKKRARKFVRVDAEDQEWQDIVLEIGNLFPRIVYFPTFLFDFPEKILVSNGESDIEGNEYFKNMVEDALASLEDPLDLQTHIVDRIIEKDPEISFGIWLPFWQQSDEKERVTSALAKLSQHISKEIFGKWIEVLGGDLRQKELVIDHYVERCGIWRTAGFFRVQSKGWLFHVQGI